MLKQDIIAASERIKDHVRRTTFERSSMISDLTGADVWLKMENQQYTGSFKFRGAINKMLTLSQSERESGIYGASTGNHGAAVAYACKKLNVPSIIYVPEKSSDAKLANMKSYGAEIRVFGKDCMDGELKAREVADTSGGVYLSPYNDPEVVNGQGTIAREIETQCDRLDTVIVSVGGGGLISGIGGYLKQVQPQIQMVACSPKNSCVMYESLNAGRILDLPSKQTLSDGTAGGVEEGSITFDICKEIIDKFILVTEKEIISGIRNTIDNDHQLIEGSAGAAIAAFVKSKDRLIGKKVVIIICGGNINSNTLSKILP